jgi:UrcA family protein
VEKTIVLQRGARQVLIAGLATVALGLASTNSFASTFDNGVRQVKVSYAELDLSKQAGAQALYGRIKQAARTVCGSNDSMPWNQIDTNRCIKTAVNDAVAKVNAPLLTALHQSQNTRLASK